MDDDDGAVVTVVVACWALGGEVVDVVRSGLVPSGVEVGTGDVVGDGRFGAVVPAPGWVVVGTTVVVVRGTVVVGLGVMIKLPAGVCTLYPWTDTVLVVLRTSSHRMPSPMNSTTMRTVDRRTRSRAESGRRRPATMAAGFMWSQSQAPRWCGSPHPVTPPRHAEAQLPPHVELPTRQRADEKAQLHVADLDGFHPGHDRIADDLVTPSLLGRHVLGHVTDHRDDVLEVLLHRDGHVQDDSRPVLREVRHLAQGAVGNHDDLALLRPQLGHPERQLLHRPADAGQLPGRRQADLVAHPELMLREEEEAGQEVTDDLLSAEPDGHARYRGRGDQAGERDTQLAQAKEAGDEIEQREDGPLDRLGDRPSPFGPFRYHLPRLDQVAHLPIQRLPVAFPDPAHRPGDEDRAQEEQDRRQQTVLEPVTDGVEVEMHRLPACPRDHAGVVDRQSDSRRTARPTGGRCSWAETSDAMRAYHDEEWGVPSRDEAHLFEMLILEGAQAGLSWSTILAKRENYRRAFAGFDADRVATFDDATVEALLQDPGIVRNRLKVRATVANARGVLAVRHEFGSFAAYVWGWVDGSPIVHRPTTLGDLAGRDELSDRISKDLKRRGFSFVGSTIVYSFLQAVGVVDDHIVGCPFKRSPHPSAG